MALAVERLPETTRIASLPVAIAVYWHLLSLDAPSVAALWSWSFARAAHITLPPLAPLLLAVGTWLVYVADRLLDGMDSRNRAQLQVRHHFYLQHRRLFVAVGAAVCPVFIWIVFTRMAPAARREDAIVFALAALYFLLVHARGRGAGKLLPKELAVGVLFAAATAVPAWARIAGDRLQLVPAIFVFAVLCWLNCVAIESWEQSVADRFAFPGHRTTHRRTTPRPAHGTTVWAGLHLQPLTAATALLSAALALACRHDTARFCLYLACAVSAVLLFWLARSERHLTAMQLRVAADAALLTPLVFGVWMR